MNSTLLLIKKSKVDFDSKLLNCVHCGICLQSCPTYLLSGDENNSPRGRLQMIRAIEEKRIEDNDVSDHYLDECVGCLSCTTACPANVPYEEILLEKRAQRVKEGKKVDYRIKMVSKLIHYPRFFQILGWPLRLLRRLNLRPSPLIFEGKPALFQSTASYAQKLQQKHQPQGPKVALFTGCLMESTYREINFATVNVLVKLGYQVAIPQDQTCCGAVAEHAGIEGKNKLNEQNNRVFNSSDAEIILSNSAGCGLALKHGSGLPVEDVLTFIAKQTLPKGNGLSTEHIYIDQPCHLVHGQKSAISDALLNTLNTPYSFAPLSTECCGAGGTYNLTHKENSTKMIEKKTAFLKDSPHKHAILATANHICMQQWNKGLKNEGLQNNVKVKHLIQLLDESLNFS